MGFVLLGGCLWGQASYEETQSLPSPHFSGGPVGFTDVDNNGWDDLVILDRGITLVILFQDQFGFQKAEVGAVSDDVQWCAAVGDIDGDGCKDLISGGEYDGVHCVRLSPNGTGVFEELAEGDMFMQGLTLVDLDGDGINDVFACHDDALSKLWRGEAGGIPEPDAGLIPLTDYEHEAYADTDHSGNYSVTATDVDGDGDLDVHIAKCRQFVNDPQDPRRVNQMWINDGEGGWTEEAAVRGLVLYEQSWTADFGDVDNDGDMDALVTNHSASLTLLENDGQGNFTDITEESGLNVVGFFLQAKMADLDNDGDLDILTSGGINAQRLMLGDGTGSFTPADWPFGDDMLSFAIGDYGRDGRLDVYGTYGGVYVQPSSFESDQLHAQVDGGHHWIALDVQGAAHNGDAVGAHITVHGPWGLQVREIRAGEGYGLTHSHHVHFGLGDEVQVDSIVVRFPQGGIQVLTEPEIDQYHEVVEGDCFIAPVALASDTLLECEGQAVAIVVSGEPASVHWNTGDVGSTLSVLEPGHYRAWVVDSAGCVGMTSPVRVTQDIVTPPQLMVGPLIDRCMGESVLLTADQEGQVMWSNGSEDPSLEVTVSGDYFVDVMGNCGTWLRSDTTTIAFHPTPSPPVVQDLVVDMPLSLELGPFSPSTHWYVEDGATEPLHVGPTLTTPVLTASSTYWVENQWLHEADTVAGGKSQPGAGGFLQSSSYWIEFDVFRDLILDSVTVKADEDGPRWIALVGPDGDVLDSTLVDLDQGTSRIGLGFHIPIGNQYGLRCLDLFPGLWRDDASSVQNYPYHIGDLATITGTNIANSTSQDWFYYFFYDWLVRAEGVTCASERMAFHVDPETPGCTYPHASNYMAMANVEDGSCLWLGCTDPMAVNHHPANNLDNGSCLYVDVSSLWPCPSDLDLNGEVGVTDLLFLLGDFGTWCTE